MIRFFRKKTRSLSLLRVGDKLARVLEALPTSGPLFPNFSRVRETHRATEFARACRRAEITGVTLHSYRYAWAERAKMCGYPERFAQTALGHNSCAVHEAYAGGALPICPALDDYEQGAKEKTVPFPVVGAPTFKGAEAPA